MRIGCARAPYWYHDITDRQRLEETRRDFVANASHELRTPLSLIMGSAEILPAGAKDDLEANERFLNIIDKHVSGPSDISDFLRSVEKPISYQSAPQPTVALSVVHFLGVLVYPLLSLAFASGLLVFLVMGLISAIDGEKKLMPVMGALYQKWLGDAFE